MVVVLSYGLIGGIGLGFGYIVPVAVLVKWFPDKRGLITGIAVVGLGRAPHHRPRGNATHSERWCLEHICLPRHRLFHRDNNFRLLYAESARRLEAGGLDADSEGNIGTRRPRLRFERGTEDLAVVGALAAVVSQYLRRHFGHLAGGTDFSGTNEGKRGRCRWHGGSGQPWKRRRPSLLGMGFGSDHETGNIFCDVPSQVLLFWFLPSVASASLITIVTFVVLMCYGGGFGTMPAFTADYFGPKNVGPIYGLMLTAWGFASAVGPLFIAHMRETTGSYSGALHVIAG